MAQGDYDYKQQPPPPPEDLEEQAGAVRNAAEAAAIVLFVNAVMNDDEPTGADVQVVRTVYGNLVKGIARLAIASAGDNPTRRSGQSSPLSNWADDLGNKLSAIATAEVQKLLVLVRSIRQSNRKAPPRDPGELSLAREAARNFATWAYGLAIEAVAPAIVRPEWLAGTFTLKKTWITQHDGRVRPLHRRLHGKTVGWDKDFWRWPDTGLALRFPGDPQAPLNSTIGCRCLCWLSFSKAGDLVPAIKELPPLTAAGYWNPALHPRAKDGKFIEVGSWVRGLFRAKGVPQRERRVKVTRVVDTSHGSLVYGIDVDTGEEVQAPADNIEVVAPTKAVLDGGEDGVDTDYRESVAFLQSQFDAALGQDLHMTDPSSFEEFPIEDLMVLHGGRGPRLVPSDKLVELERISTEAGAILDTEILRRMEADGSLLTYDQYAEVEVDLKFEIAQVSKKSQDRLAELAGVTWEEARTSMDARLALVAAADNLAPNDPLTQELHAERDRLTAKWQRLPLMWVKHRRSYAKYMAAVLAETVPGGIGGKVNYYTADDQLPFQIEQTVETLFPSTWIEASNDLDKTDAGMLSISREKVMAGRSYYQPGRGSMHLAYLDGAPQTSEDIIHEFMHRMEDSVSGIGALEAAFYWRRVGGPFGDKMKTLAELYGNPGYGKDEWARPDKFPTPYMGKEYDGVRNWELASVGAELLLSPGGRAITRGSPEIFDDADFRAWLLGVFVSVKAKPVSVSTPTQTEGVSDV